MRKLRKHVRIMSNRGYRRHELRKRWILRRPNHTLLPAFSLTFLFLSLLPSSLPAQVQAQQENARAVSRHTFVNVYRQARLQTQLDEILKEIGRSARPMPPEHVPSAGGDSIQAWIIAHLPDSLQPVPNVPSFVVENQKLVSKENRLLWTRHFRKTTWAYLGGTTFNVLDTLRTRDIRARMQAQFGDPTRTLAEIRGRASLVLDEYIQFEYWFVLNDTIPVIVMDTNGPFDRGVVVAIDERFRDHLPLIRSALLEEVLKSPLRRPYIDYYYSKPRRRWYTTGYDGVRFFLHAITEPNLAQGRPQLILPGE